MANSPDSKRRIMHVLKYIWENCDEEFPAFSAPEIVDELESEYGIIADRRAVYSDIAAIRDVLELDIEGTPSGKYRLLSRPFSYDELCLIAECIHAAKFIPEEQGKELVEKICRLTSNPQADRLTQEVFLCQRVKNGQENVLETINAIRKAIRQKRKIKFKYLHREINDITKQVERNLGRAFTVSPYNLIISDGNYYMLAYSDMVKDMRLFRVDKIAEIEILEILQAGSLVYEKVNLTTYTNRVFFMNPGETQKVSLRFERKLLDSVIERVGSNIHTMYRPDGPKHFVVNTEIEISNQFFGWLASFGPQARILHPPKVADEYCEYLQSIILNQNE